MRPVLVGSANPNYTPLDQISPYLRKSVLTTEILLSSHIVVLSLKLSNNPLLKTLELKNLLEAQVPSACN
jgi:hypothetical protein